MKLPRDISGEELADALSRLGYRRVRQRGSHLRLVADVDGGHHLTVPMHQHIKIGTLSAILNDLAQRQGVTREELLEQLFG